ncbi:MAG: hypothetical protein ACK5LY_03180 [Lachnospirales bacterium]
MSINFAYLKNEINNKKLIPLFFIGIMAILYIFLIAINNGNSSNTTAFFYFAGITGLYILLMFFCTIYQLDFFHSKKKVDVYHSLPATRNSLFLTNLLVVPILVMLPFFLVFITSTILYFGFGSTYTITFSLKLLVISIFSYSILTFFSTLTSNKITYGIVTLVMFVAPWIIIFITNLFFTYVINSGISIDNTWQTIFNFLTLSDVNNFYAISFLFIGLQLALSCLFYYLGFYNYKKFKSEDVKNPITSKILEQIFIMTTAFIISMAFILILTTKFVEFNVLTVIILLLLQLFFYCLVSKLAKVKIKSKNLIVFISIGLVYSLISFFDVFQIGNYIPKKEDIVSIEIDSNLISNELYNEVKEFQSSMYEDDYSDVGSESGYGKSITIKYYLSNDTSIRRDYNPNGLEYYNDIKKIVENEENKKNTIDILEEILIVDEENETYDINIMYGIFNTYSGTFIDKIYGQFTFNDDNNSIKASIDLKNRLITALIEEIKEDDSFNTFDERKIPVASVSFDIYSPYTKTVDNIYISSDYEKTLAVISDELGIDDMYKDKTLVAIANPQTRGSQLVAIEKGYSFMLSPINNYIEMFDNFYSTSGEYISFYGNNGEVLTSSEGYKIFMDSLYAQYDVKDIIDYNSNKSEFLDYINNQLVYINASDVIPVLDKDKTLVDVYILYQSYGYNEYKYLGSYYE